MRKVQVLTSLVLIFVSPATADNHEVRQCLAYFLPAYCYLSLENQTRMQKVPIMFYAHITRLRLDSVQIGIMSLNMVHKVNDELSEDEEMVTPYQFGLLLVEWTDPRHLVKGCVRLPSFSPTFYDFGTGSLAHETRMSHLP